MHDRLRIRPLQIDPLVHLPFTGGFEAARRSLAAGIQPDDRFWSDLLRRDPARGNQQAIAAAG